MVIFISGVNINNHTLVYDIAGLAGYALRKVRTSS